MGPSYCTSQCHDMLWSNVMQLKTFGLKREFFYQCRLAIVHWCWKRRNFTHSQTLCIVFSFVLAKVQLLTYINVPCLHTFYDVENLFIHTSCNIFHSHTGEHTKTNKNDDLIDIPLQIMRDDLKNFTFVFLHVQQYVMLENMRHIEKEMGKPQKYTNRHTRHTYIMTPPSKMFKQTMPLLKMGSKFFDRAFRQISIL